MRDRIMIKDIDMIKKTYYTYRKKVEEGRKLFGRSLTFTEKVLIAHLDGIVEDIPKRLKSYINFNPDRVAMQDATAQMALLQFMMTGRESTAVSATVHCDHLVRAEVGADVDLANALNENSEIYDFLHSVSQKYGIGFWKPGAGIIHQIILENYAFPGGMMIGTDSHTVNAGGLGMIAVGVGGADAVDVMSGIPWELLWPGIIGVKLVGKLDGWASPKDVILKLAGILTAKGATGHIIEYFGEGTQSISCTGKATITNMGAEVGATTSIFPFDERMVTYLRATERDKVAEIAESITDCLTADSEVEENPEAFYDQVIEIDLCALEPYVVGPFTPDLARPISKFCSEVKEKNYPEKLDVALIGSCTNSSYEDIERSAHVARQTIEKGLSLKSELMISPGSEKIRATIHRDGQLQTLEEVGGVVLANACGPCIGQWTRHGREEGEKNSIITSFNRNFARRNDGNSGTYAFIASPELVTAMAFGGSMTFNPLTDTLINQNGEEVKLDPPAGDDLPVRGFKRGKEGFLEPPEDRHRVQVTVSPESERLQLLSPFDSWDGQDMTDLLILLKAKGKCTTDHISPAGPWLRFRGHLDNISNNMFIGAVNAFSDEAGTGKNIFTGGKHIRFSDISRDYKSRGIGWVVIGDDNYGEGSSREHAAMEPRYLGARAIIVKSFARIHETNLKKQGVLALTFANPEDYEKIREDDRISIIGLDEFTSGKPVKAEIFHADGKRESIELNHSYSQQQIDWFKAGSALNKIREELDHK